MTHTSDEIRPIYLHMVCCTEPTLGQSFPPVFPLAVYVAALGIRPRRSLSSTWYLSVSFGPVVTIDDLELPDTVIKFGAS